MNRRLLRTGKKSFNHVIGEDRGQLPLLAVGIYLALFLGAQSTGTIFFEKKGTSIAQVPGTK